MIKAPTSADSATATELRSYCGINHFRWRMFVRFGQNLRILALPLMNRPVIDKTFDHTVLMVKKNIDYYSWICYRGGRTRIKDFEASRR